MRRFGYSFLLWALSVTGMAAQDFLADQRRYPRVREAITEKGGALDAVLARNGLAKGDLNILMVAFKAEKKLHVYGKTHSETNYAKIATYDICALSGKLGPKRRQGDRQIPEGFYRIDRFNPSSNYHLALGINYPNAADMKKSESPRGGDIFIHGACVTIGCLPVTDNGIKEIYLYAVYACDCGQEDIPVYIFPFEMTDANTRRYLERAGSDHELVSFWKNLRQGYDIFMRDGKELTVKVDAEGDYLFR